MKKYNDPLHNEYLKGMLFKKLNLIDDAFPYFETAANGDHIKACYEMGLLEKAKDLDDLDYHILLKWFEKAANGGHTDAQYHFGTMSTDNIIGIKWIRKAAKKGHTQAMCEMGDYYTDSYDEFPNNIKKVIYWYTLAADMGDKEAMYQLGVTYFNSKKIELSFKYFNKYKNNEGRYERVDYYIGWMYYYGYGTDQNYKKARKWLKKIARNYPKASHKLGLIYYYGYGVKKNHKVAYKWFKMGFKDSEDSLIYMRRIDNE